IAVTLPVAPTSSARICRVIADADADMQDMLPWLGRGGGNQRRMKRGLAVVQVTLRQDAEHVVGVQVNRVGIRRRTIPAAPAHDVPGAGSEEVLPRHRGEGRLELRISDADDRRDLLPIGPPDDLQFALAIFALRLLAGEAIWPR